MREKRKRDANGTFRGVSADGIFVQNYAALAKSVIIKIQRIIQEEYFMKIYVLLSEGKESCDVACVSTDLMDIRRAIKQVLESPNYPTLQIWENGKMKAWLAGDDVLHKIAFVLDIFQKL